ncbi:MAG TPA: glycosyltransferase family 4 protein [Planctomycetota bacterium]|jgi:glycosyltransferase involved in cell wall biosynthesis
MAQARPNVLQLCLTLDTGGLERVVVNLANELAALGLAQSHICTVGHTQSALIPADIAPDVRWTELHGPSHFTFPTALRLFNLLRRERIDLIHAHGTQPLVYALMSTLPRRVPIVFTKHNSYEDLGFFLRRGFFRRLACHRVSAFAGVSEPATGILQRVFARAASRCVTQINGTVLPARKLHNTVMLARSEARRDDKFVIATVCRLAPEKDIGTLLEAFAALHAQVPGIELWIVGDGAQRTELMQVTDSLGINEHVRFWGFRGKVDQILTCADLYVNSSLTEGISISILEAMSLGLPVVATNVGGTPSIVDESNGLLVPARDAPALCAAMLRLVRDRALAASMGQASRQVVAQKWSVKQMAERYMALYRRALTPKAKTPPEVRRFDSRAARA